MTNETQQEKIQQQIEAYSQKIIEQLTQEELPGLGMSAAAFGLSDTQTDQLVLDMLQELRLKIGDLQGEIWAEAQDEGRVVRMPA